MAKTKRLKNGEYRSWGEKMADGTWCPAGSATMHTADATEDYRLPTVGPYFGTEKEAEEIAMERLIAWGDENYPTDA